MSIDKEPIKIEILMSTLGVTFDECYRNRNVIEVEGLPVNFISLPDLIKNKRALGRPKDLLDLDNLPPGA